MRVVVRFGRDNRLTKANRLVFLVVQLGNVELCMKDRVSRLHSTLKIKMDAQEYSGFMRIGVKIHYLYRRFRYFIFLVSKMFIATHYDVDTALWGRWLATPRREI